MTIGWERADAAMLSACKYAAPFNAQFYPDAAGVELTEFTPISDQGRQGSCVANAVCDAYELLLGYSLPEGMSVPNLSRRWVHWIARSYDGTEREHSGTYIHVALEQIAKLGVCREEECPYDDRIEVEAPPIEAFVRASENRIEGYELLTGESHERVLQVKQSLTLRRPVPFGTLVGPAFMAAYGAQVFGPPPVEQAIGGHAMIIVGYRDDIFRPGKTEFKVRNSWGTAWGQYGYTWINEEYLTAPFTGDLASITRAILPV